ncbi:MAG TPA: hypothetical protein VMT10_10195 [Solirubrobacteraceae bacterium]|nr:hypothetical protein [Solirubrobacteraceae bacterium]
MRSAFTPTPMRHEHDSTTQVRLPSGRMIEVVYLDEPAIAPAGPSDAERRAVAAEAAADLMVCGLCGCEFVQPIDWDEAGSRHWRVTLRCPNCEAHGTVVVQDEVVDQYDLALERGSAALALSLHGLVEENIDDEVTRFAEALDRDHILPEDF